MALTDETGQSDLWVVEIGSSGRVNLTDDEWRDEYPAWSPDDARIAFIREDSTSSVCP